MTATVTVRDATVHDVAELAALAASAYRETYRTMMDAGVTEAVIAQSCTAPAFTRLLEGEGGLLTQNRCCDLGGSGALLAPAHALKKAE